MSDSTWAMATGLMLAALFATSLWLNLAFIPRIRPARLRRLFRVAWIVVLPLMYVLNFAFALGDVL